MCAFATVISFGDFNLGCDLDLSLGVKVQSENDKTAAPAIINSENVTLHKMQHNILCDPWLIFFKHKFNILLFCR